jgi:dihydrofolate synthase
LLHLSGLTRKDVKLSEARSYYNVALTLEHFGLLEAGSPAIKANPRILLDEFALDSYYNILLSLGEFWRSTGKWPSRLSIVSHGFKRRRIVDGHCGAIGFPLDRVKYIGIDPPNLPDFDQSTSQPDAIGVPKDAGRAQVMKGVLAAEQQWASDPRGVGPILAGKRARRNAWNSKQELFRSDEERRRSGVDTEFADGTETLVEGGRRPWAA